jgi:hypothetical protein
VARNAKNHVEPKRSICSRIGAGLKMEKLWLHLGFFLEKTIGKDGIFALQVSKIMKLF